MNVPPKPQPKGIKLDKTIDVSQLSEDTIGIIKHFGLDAPSLLNNYSIALEDALIEQCRFRQQADGEIRRLRKILEEQNIPH